MSFAYSVRIVQSACHAHVHSVDDASMVSKMQSHAERRRQLTRAGVQPHRQAEGDCQNTIIKLFLLTMLKASLRLILSLASRKALRAIHVCTSYKPIRGVRRPKYYSHAPGASLVLKPGNEDTRSYRNETHRCPASANEATGGGEEAT